MCQCPSGESGQSTWSSESKLAVSDVRGGRWSRSQARWALRTTGTWGHEEAHSGILVGALGGLGWGWQ